MSAGIADAFLVARTNPHAAKHQNTISSTTTRRKNQKRDISSSEKPSSGTQLWYHLSQEDTSITSNSNWIEKWFEDSLKSVVVHFPTPVKSKRIDFSFKTSISQNTASQRIEVRI